MSQQLAAAERGMACVAIEGEPGIGKTRLLVEVRDLALGQGFVSLEITADEEIRGPFLVARGLLASPSLMAATQGTEAEKPLRQALDALSNNDDPGLKTLAPDQRILRTFDLASVAFHSAAAHKPLAILVDDLQWADEDSLRLLRYVARSNASSRILLVFATRSSEVAFVNEAVTLLADLDRMGLLRRIKLNRFNQAQTTEFLEQVLGGKVDSGSAVIMHAQAEGVPFVLAEQVQAYRENGLIQQIDGVWSLARNSERLLPSAVRTLIQRRVTNLPEETRECLADAAILGRSFSLRDLSEVRRSVQSERVREDELSELLAPAVKAGLLDEHADGSAADYSFAHDQIRQFSAASLPTARRKALHMAVVTMLTGGGEPPAEALPTLVQHALAAGQNELCARAAIASARASLKANAPEEVLRVVELAHSVASTAQDRVDLLLLRDDALTMLRQPSQRLESLAELGALAEAMGDTRLEMDVLLRRASAFRLSNDVDVAVSLAKRVRELAVERGDREVEMHACIELGQDYLGVEMGEAYTQSPQESDLDGGEEAYSCAAALAEELHDEALLAAVLRELGMLKTSRFRWMVVSGMIEGHHLALIKRIVNGERLEDLMPEMPEPTKLYMEASDLYQRALEIFERLGDKPGSMATVIGLATLTWAPEIHLGGSAHRIEELRRLTSRMKAFTRESERALADAQMLYGSHVYARAKVFPDFAIKKGEEAYMASVALGDHALQFAAAGGTALAYLEVEMQAEAERWLSRAAAVAASAPTPHRARQLEYWRGLVAAGAGDAERLRETMSRAVELSQEAGLPAESCEYLSHFALQAARLGAESSSEELLALAERTASEALALARQLTGHPTWGARADAALAIVAGSRGDTEAAAQAGRSALAAIDAAMQEDMLLDIIIPAVSAVLAVAEGDEADLLRDRLALMLSVVARHILDEDIRTRWFRGRQGRALTDLVGAAGPASAFTESDGSGLTDAEAGLLSLVTQGLTNEEIATELGSTEEDVTRQIGSLFVKIGVVSRAGATATALLGKLI